MHHIKSILGLAFFACSLFSHPLLAQDYRPGYIIMNSGDSINGFVSYSTGNKNLSQCSFKKTKRSKAVHYTAAELNAYGVFGDRQYISATLPGESFSKDKVFLRVIANGPMNLYRLGKQFLIKKDSLVALPIPQKKQIDTEKGLRIKDDKRYVGILNQLLFDCQLTANESDYAEVDFTNLINNYNRCKGQEPPYKKPRPFAKMNYQLFGGYVQSKMETKLDNDLLFNSSSTIVGGLGFDFSSPRVFDRLFLSVEAWYVKSLYQAYAEGPFSGGTLYQDIFMDISFIKVPIGLRYNFLKENNTPYIKGGFSVCLIHDTAVKTVIEHETIDGTVFGRETYGGYDLKNPKGVWVSVGYDKTIFRNLRMFAEFRYESGEGFVGTSIQSFSTMKNYNFLLGIRL